MLQRHFYTAGLAVYITLGVEDSHCHSPTTRIHHTMNRLSTFILTILSSTALLGAELPEPGVMLRSGTWDGGVGTYTVPDQLAKLKPPKWPNEGWQRLEILNDRIKVSMVPTSSRQRPKFLEQIATQVTAGESGTSAEPASPVETTTATENTLFTRFPSLRLRTGELPLYLFKNGTPNLSPKLDHRYELNLADMRFAFTVQNGLKGRNGGTYGEGAQYTIEYDGKKYEYRLHEFGWDSRVNAIGDFDGDGKPDFLISVGGNNSGHEYLLLSSLARPGKNPASASLHSMGC